MNVEIINIGDELLIGQVVNTSSQWLAEQFDLNGFIVKRMQIVADNKLDIERSVLSVGDDVSVVVFTGGLGPTKDDLTRQFICDYFNTKLELHEESLLQLSKMFKHRGFKLTETNRQQAYIPKKSTPITNEIGTSPGFWLEKDGKIYAFLPGVPYEMKHMTTSKLIPKLNKIIITRAVVHKTILTQGVGESFLSDIISKWEDNLGEDLRLAYLPSPGLVRLRISGMGDDKTKLKNKIEEKCKDLEKLISSFIFGYEDMTLEQIIGELLRKKGFTLSTAESCTGGYIAHKITEVPSCSDYYKGSVVAYSNEIKENVLGVKSRSLEKHGAVSEEVVKEMALGVRELYGTDCSIATSGIAGPDGGTEDKPVGTVWIAVCCGDEFYARRFQYGKHRQRNINMSALSALNILRKMLLEKE